jgi:hypothetical protein
MVLPIWYPDKYYFRSTYFVNTLPPHRPHRRYHACMFRGGVAAYLMNFWKLLDLILILFYLLSVAFRTIGYLQVRGGGEKRGEEGGERGGRGGGEKTAREEEECAIAPPHPLHPPHLPVCNLWHPLCVTSTACIPYTPCTPCTPYSSRQSSIRYATQGHNPSRSSTTLPGYTRVRCRYIDN